MSKTKYKQTAVGLIPEDWEVRRLGEIGKFIKGKAILKDQIENMGLPCIRYGEIYSKYQNAVYKLDSFINQKIASESQSITYGDILMAGSGESVNEIGKAVVYLDNQVAYAGGDIIIFRSNLNNPEVICSLLESKHAKKQKRVMGQGNSVVHIYSSDLAKLYLPIPPLPEQKKIAAILSTWDMAIERTKAIIEELKIRNRGLGQYLFNEKLRMKNGEWKEKPISAIVKQIKNPVKIELKTPYRQLGIRSHAKGIFYKEAVSGLELGNKSVFHVQPNCFILNIVFAWELAIAVTTEKEVDFIVSHRFPMFKPETGILDLNYLLYFFKSQKGKDLLVLASPGGAGRNKTLGQKEFLSLKIPVPNLKTQNKISQVLDASTKELNEYQNKLSVLQQQKKGLMQVLLTGKVRV